MSASRNHALDATRAYAMGIVVLTHAAMSYMVTPVGWAIQDTSRHLAADLFVWIVRGMIMPLFFWLAGYFARAVYEHAGPAGFIQHRARRILVPLVVAIVPVSFALNALWDWGRVVGGRDVVPGHVPALDGSSLPLTLGHLWFLYYLLVMSAVALAIVPLARKLRLRVPWPLLAGAVSLAPLAYRGALGLDTPLGFALDIDVLVYEGAFFAWGWLVHADRDELDRSARRAWPLLIAAAALLAVLVPVLRGSGDVPAYAIPASGVFSLLLVDASVGLCVRYVHRPHRFVRLAADASFGVYIVHFPIVVLLQIGFAQLALPGPLELVAIVAITLTVTLGTLAVVRRVTVAG